MTADDPARDWGGRFVLTGWSAARRDAAAGPAWTSALALCDELTAERTALLEIDPAVRAGVVDVSGRIRVGTAVRRLTAQLRPLADTAEGTLTGVRAGSPVQVVVWAEPGRRLLTVLGHEPGTPRGQVQRFWYRALAAPLTGAPAGREPDPLPPPRPTAPTVPDWIATEVRICTNGLRGAVLSRRDNAFDRDYSGGSTYHEQSATLRFVGDRYRLEERSFSRVSIAGMSASSPRGSTSAGTWEVVPGARGARLVLRDDDGTVRSHTVLTGVRTAKLDGVVWARESP